MFRVFGSGLGFGAELEAPSACGACLECSIGSYDDPH